jgi:FKBP-type peptidyl-prolyl cis-trans isomerase SlyD
MKKLLGLLVISGAVLASLYFLTSLVNVGARPASQAVTLKPAGVIQKGSIVSIEYTLTDDAGAAIDSNVGKEPLTYIQGAGQIVPGLERELLGLKVGEQKKIHVKPEDGYGMPDQKAFRELPKEQLPAEALKVGAMLMSKSADGGVMPVRVHQVKEKTVVVDFNHPLAGKTLHFEVTVKNIQSAQAK